MFERFPYTNFHELNLDWIIQKIKEIEQNAVMSVNGQTGTVILYQDPDIQFPDVNSNTWRMVRTAGGNTVGIMFQNGLAYIMSGNQASRIFTQDNPPPYPVTSVNGKTGAVTTYDSAYNRLPGVTEQNTNFYRTVDKDGTPVDVGVQVDKNKIERMSGSGRYQVYDTGNPPPYPVTSVNGQTGAIVLAIPFDSPLTDSVWMSTEASEDHTAGIGRETVDGTVQIYTVTDGTHAEAFVHFVSSDDQYSYTKKLLTTDDIPSSSGVVSVNGANGVVTLYGSDLYINSGSNKTIDTAISDILSDLAPPLVNMKPAVTIPAGEYVQIDGVFYKNISGASLPANTTVSMSSLQAVDSLGLVNELYSIEESIVAEISNISAGSITAESVATATQVVTKNNYHAIGIVGYNLSGTGGSNCGVMRVFLSNISGSSATINVNVRNFGSSDTGDITCAVRVLWLKS